MSAADFLDYAELAALALLSLSLLLTVLRVLLGPTLPDRILALDMLTAVVIGFIAVLGIRTGYALYVDIAIALGLVGFLSTVAFARYLMTQAKRKDEGPLQRLEEKDFGA